MGVKKFRDSAGRIEWALSHIDTVMGDDGKTLREILIDIQGGGILPGTITFEDLEKAIQDSLGLADTSVQPGDMDTKQDTLVSGTNIKTINGYSLLGSGNLDISGGGGGTQVQSDWNEADDTKPAYIKNKPSIPAAQVNADWNAGSGVAQILNKPTIPDAQIQSDWEQADDTAKDYIKNKPTIPAAQVNADWEANSGVAQILNKPTIPAAQVNSDWNSSSGVSEILNKPSLATVATSGSYNDLNNKPSIPAAQIQSDWEQSDNTAKDYIKNKPTIPAEQVNADWNSNSGKSQILNKPTIPDAQIQSDWDQSDNTAKDYIKNKPQVVTSTTAGLKIEVVAAMPAQPDANTIYIVQ